MVLDDKVLDAQLDEGGSVTFARPSIGSWVSYGLGTLNTNLPSFVVLAEKEPYTAFQAALGDPVRASTIGIVEASKADGFAPWFARTRFVFGSTSASKSWPSTRPTSASAPSRSPRVAAAGSKRS